MAERKNRLLNWELRLPSRLGAGGTWPTRELQNMTGLTRVDLAGGLDHVDDVQVVQRPLAEGGVAGAGTAGGGAVGHLVA